MVNITRMEVFSFCVKHLAARLISIIVIIMTWECVSWKNFNTPAPYFRTAIFFSSVALPNVSHTLIVPTPRATELLEEFIELTI